MRLGHDVDRCSPDAGRRDIRSCPKYRALKAILVLCILLSLEQTPLSATAVNLAEKAPSSSRAVSPPACAIALGALRRRCLLVSPLGHRGQEYPPARTNENTIFALAFDGQVGAGCETDTWRLAGDDGTPNQGISVIFHDSTTISRVVSARSMNAAGVDPKAVIGQVTRRQFEMLRTKGGQPLPTLQEWIRYAALHHIPCSVEIKWGPASAEEVANWIQRYNGTRLISFNQRPQAATSKWSCSLSDLDRMRDAGIRTALKTAADCPLDLQAIHDRGYQDVIADQQLLTAAYINRAHALGLRVGNKLSDAPSIWRLLLRRNINFLIAAHPRALVRWLGQDRAPLTRPSAPARVSAIAGSRQLTLRWTPPRSDGGSAITFYQVRLGSQRARNVSRAARRYSFSRLRNGHRYALFVRAHNRQGFGRWARTTATPRTQRPARAYRLVWRDEFNGSSIDPRHWNVLNNQGLSYDKAMLTSRRDNIFVSGGRLTIRSLRERRSGTVDGHAETREFTSGYLDTRGKASWRYGRFSVRARLATQAGTSKGIWPAFWMRPNGGGPGEIDILEAIGSDANASESSRIHVSIHHDYSTGQAHIPKQTRSISFPPGGSPSTSFHTYTLEWVPGLLTWRIDGATVWRRNRQTTPWFTQAFSRPYHLRLNQQVGGSWPGDPAPTTSFPADYKVDWVRVYQRR